jgi:hypothetical protein
MLSQEESAGNTDKNSPADEPPFNPDDEPWNATVIDELETLSDGLDGKVLYLLDDADDAAILREQSGVPALDAPPSKLKYLTLKWLMKVDRIIVIQRETPPPTYVSLVQQHLERLNWLRSLEYCNLPEPLETIRKIWKCYPDVATFNRNLSTYMGTNLVKVQLKSRRKREYEASRDGQPKSRQAVLIRMRDVQTREIKWLWKPISPLACSSCATGILGSARRCCGSS